MLKIIPGGYLLNGEKTEKLIGRSSFKLANIISYHYTGAGGGPYSLGAARKWVEYNQKLFGEHVVLRVLLETEGWGICDDCMFGSEPRDQGFWNVEALKDGHREKAVHPVGKHVLEWFFKTSHETGVAFELVIDSTLKHTEGVKAGEVDHVIRQVGIEMGKLSLQYPRSLIIPNVRNEWNAHNKTGHTISDVNMWAVRWERDQYWPGSQPIVSPGGGDMYTYAVGRPGSGKFAMGLIHPDRQPDGRNWWDLPDISRLRNASNRMPVGFDESKFYVEPADTPRAERWYRHRLGWTNDFAHYKIFAERAMSAVNYFIFHDEKGLQCNSEWPRPELTALEQHFRVDTGVEPPPTLPDQPDSDDPDPVEPPDDSSWLEDLLSKIDIGDAASVLPLILGLLKGDGPSMEELQTLIKPFHDKLDRIEQNTNLILNAIDDLELIVVVDDDVDEPNPTPEPPLKPVKPTDYIPWQDREEWAARLELAYTEWRGHRDLQYLYDHWTEADAEGLGLSQIDLAKIINDMISLQKESRRLQHRIKNEQHREFADRSQVRKNVANKLKTQLEKISKVYYGIAAHYPEVEECDSIKCKLQKMRT